MAVSKINQADAQEWLESLQQVGEGWYRQVAVALRANAHKALDMTPKEFAQAIGQKMVDPRDAIIQLHNEGHSMKRISETLSVSMDRVNVVLQEEGYIEELPAYVQKKLDAGKRFGQTEAHTDETVGQTEAEDAEVEYEEVDVEALEAEIETLKLKAKGERAKAKRDADALREKVRNAAKDKADALKKQRLEFVSELTDQERARFEKEAEAWAREKGESILISLAGMLVGSITDTLREAAQGVHDLVEKGYVTTEYLRQIEQAHASFIDELNVARMSEKS